VFNELKELARTLPENKTPAPAVAETLRKSLLENPFVLFSSLSTLPPFLFFY
jgi:hypothetical protein